MKQSKKLVMAGLVASTIAGGALFTTAVGAQASQNRTSLADAIAAKFNLKSEDVQTVIKDYRETHRAEHEQEMKAKLSERLDQAVSDGKITEDQKQLILTKLEEAKTKMDEIHDMTDSDARHTAMEQLRADLQSWAQENNIPDGLMSMGGPGKHGGRHGGMMRGGFDEAPDDAPTENTN